MGPYDLGAGIPPADLQFSLTDAAGNPVTAAQTPVLTITLPDQSTVTPAVTSPSLGVWEPSSQYVTAQSGHHLWAWTAGGSTPGAYVDSFEVRVAPDPTIISLAEARDILKMGTDTSRDSDIRGYSQAVTEWVEYVAGPVVTRQITEIVRAQGNALVLSKAPIRTDMGTTLDASNRRDGSTTNGLVSITPLLTYGFMYDLAQLLVDGPKGIVRQSAGLPFFYSGDPFSQYQVIYWAGRKVIPWGIYEASKITLKHVWAVERGGVQQGSAFGESETTMTGFGFAVPNRAVELLTPHAGPSKAAIA